MKRNKWTALLILSMVSAYPIAGLAEAMKTIKLLPPQTESGKPLMKTLAERKSMREFSSEELPLQVLSDLLWAANGVNRPDGRRTAPSAHNAQEIDIYVAKKEALYLYNAKQHELAPVRAGDIRPLVGKQSFVKHAPIGLVFVADFEKFRGAPEEDAKFYSAADTGYISQNVYLFCASAGLSTVVLGWVDRADLAKEMHLRPGQRVILAQPVGYSENKK